MPDAASGPGLTDPCGLGAAVGRLSGSSRKNGQAAFLVLATALEPGEVVEIVAFGRFLGAPGALCLTNGRLLAANARNWEPDVVSVPFEAGLTVQGWQDERHAALVFHHAGGDLVVDQISDREMAQQVAAGVRAKVGG